MNWGDPFRHAWQRAATNAHAAAREAALGPEQAAAVLSDEIAHTLQLALFAARDVQRLQQATDTGSIPVMAPGMESLRRAMEDVRQGRIAPDKAEKHLQQAVRAASRQAKPAPPAAGGDKAADEELRLASVRAKELHSRVRDQCSALRQRLLRSSEAGGKDAAGRMENMEYIGQLDQALAAFDHAFLDNKPVDDPAAPLSGVIRHLEH